MLISILFTIKRLFRERVLVSERSLVSNEEYFSLFVNNKRRTKRPLYPIRSSNQFQRDAGNQKESAINKSAIFILSLPIYVRDVSSVRWNSE